MGLRKSGRSLVSFSNQLPHQQNYSGRALHRPMQTTIIITATGARVRGSGSDIRSWYVCEPFQSSGTSHDFAMSVRLQW